MHDVEIITPVKRPWLGLKPLHWLGLALIALAIGLGVTALGQSLTPYVNVTEAKNAVHDVQVMGFPENQGSYTDDGVFRFTMKDEKGQAIDVLYHQPKPGNFDQAVSVVAIGHYDHTQGSFVADDLLVKCPSKYQEQDANVVQ